MNNKEESVTHRLRAATSDKRLQNAHGTPTFPLMLIDFVSSTAQKIHNVIVRITFVRTYRDEYHALLTKQLDFFQYFGS